MIQFFENITVTFNEMYTTKQRIPFVSRSRWPEKTECLQCKFECPIGSQWVSCIGGPPVLKDQLLNYKGWLARTSPIVQMNISRDTYSTCYFRFGDRTVADYKTIQEVPGPV